MACRGVAFGLSGSEETSRTSIMLLEKCSRRSDDEGRRRRVGGFILVPASTHSMGTILVLSIRLLCRRSHEFCKLYVLSRTRSCLVKLLSLKTSNCGLDITVSEVRLVRPPNLNMRLSCRRFERYFRSNVVRRDKKEKRRKGGEGGFILVP
jgi:hypothetical protein